MTDATYSRDGNFVPITNLGFITTKTVTFETATTGAVGQSVLFNVTGVVKVTVIAVVQDSLSSAGGTGLDSVGTVSTPSFILEPKDTPQLGTGTVWIKAESLSGGVAAPTYDIFVSENIVSIVRSFS
jgi:hypothetical protein